MWHRKRTYKNYEGFKTREEIIDGIAREFNINRLRLHVCCAFYEYFVMLFEMAIGLLTTSKNKRIAKWKWILDHLFQDSPRALALSYSTYNRFSSVSVYCFMLSSLTKMRWNTNKFIQRRKIEISGGRLSRFMVRPGIVELSHPQCPLNTRIVAEYFEK